MLGHGTRFGRGADGVEAQGQGSLEDRGPHDLTLISIHDDATSRLQTARFVERDTGAENRRAAIAYLRQHGRPLAFYADHAGHFGQWMTKQGRRTDTIIARGLDQLGIEMILASSPQAKGRVERSFGTAQDRLVKEMRVEGIAGLAEANRFLAERWVPFWNERFAVEPAGSGDAHRPLPAGVDLEAVFAETEQRVVANDFTVRFRNRYWQVPRAEAEGRERPRAAPRQRSRAVRGRSLRRRSRARSTRGASGSTRRRKGRSSCGNAASLGPLLAPAPCGSSVRLPPAATSSSEVGVGRTREVDNRRPDVTGTWSGPRCSSN